MKYLKEYNTVEEYIEDVSENPVNYPTLTRVVSDSNWGKKMFYRKVMTNDSNPEAMSIARSAGWVGQNDTYMTMDQALAVTDETFNAANVHVADENGPDGYSSTFANLKHFDEFQYFANVKNTTWTKTSSDPVTFQGGFFNAVNLENIKFPPQLRILGGYSFRNCGKLTEVKFPSSLKKISLACFYNCRKLSKVEFNEGFNMIEDNAFYFTDIGNDPNNPQSLPSTITYLGIQAFYRYGWYGRFTETLNLPRLMLLQAEIFINQCGSRYLNIGANLQTLGGGPDYTGTYNDIFWTTLEGITIDPECPNFKVVNNIVYSKDGTICYGGANYGLSKQSVTKVADGCTKILAGSFRDFMQKDNDINFQERAPWYNPNDEICEYIVIPASVTYIGDRALQYSKTNIVMLGSTPPTIVNAIGAAYNIYVPEEAVDTYKEASGWSGKKNKIKAITPEVQAAIS